MSAREIIRDPNVLSGRWRFEGTSIAVADVRTDADASLDRATQKYRYAGLTDEEIQAAMTFVFPDVRTTEINLEYAAVVVNCACGEDTYKSGLSEMVTIVDCACRRRWRITVTPVPAGESHSGSMGTAGGK